jgi:hypothetical protein
MIAAFAANDAFQKTAASGGHIRTKIVTLKDQLRATQGKLRLDPIIVSRKDRLSPVGILSLSQM